MNICVYFFLLAILGQLFFQYFGQRICCSETQTYITVS